MSKELLKLREKLLDLSNHNSLLSYRHPNNPIRLIDERSNQVMERLLSGKSFEFIPVKEPSRSDLQKYGYIDSEGEPLEEYPNARKWAKKIGLNISYELEYSRSVEGVEEEEKHVDKKLQTLFYPDAMDSILRKIRSKASVALEDSGVHILYLNFGFLLWFESRDSEISRLAPLISVPVKLERKKIKDRFIYSVSILNDEIMSNQTLSKKLSSNFGLVLPEPNKEILPEQYLKEVKKLLIDGNKPRWEIKNEITLTTLNFKKQIMYKDLEQSDLAKDNILQKIFSAKEVQRSYYKEVNEEFDFDNLADINTEYPLIYDADSSQYSAVIDAVRGSNLVIEGPPGSGKSQTITNLIASAISQGKSVLFVAEKMVALEVVKKRLDDAGLGGFCLELHSHKTNKKEFVSDLSESIKKRKKYPKSNMTDRSINRLEKVTNSLKAYVEYTNSLFGKTGLTVHEILNKAVRYRNEISLDPNSIEKSIFLKEAFNTDQQDELDRNLDNFSRVFIDISQHIDESDTINHYWYGVHRESFSEYDQNKMSNSLSKWSDLLEKLYASVLSCRSKVGIDESSVLFLEDIRLIVNSPITLPSLEGGEVFEGLSGVIDNLKEFSRFCDEYKNIHENLKKLGSIFKEPAFLNKEVERLIQNNLKILKDLGLNENKTLEDVSRDIDKLQKTCNDINQVKVVFKKLSNSFPNSLSKIFQGSISKQNLEEVLNLSLLFQKLPVNFWKNRSSIYQKEELDSFILLFKKQKEKILIYKNIKKHFKSSVIDNKIERHITNLQYYNSVLSSESIFKYFSVSWWKTRKALLHMGKKNINFKTMALALPYLIEYSKEVISLNKIHQSNPILEKMFTGVSTDIDTIASQREAYKVIKLQYGSKFDGSYLIADELLSVDSKIIKELHSDFKNELAEKIKILLNDIEYFKKTYSNVVCFKNETKDLADIFNFLLEKLTFVDEHMGGVIKNGNLSCSLIFDANLQLEKTMDSSRSWKESLFYFDAKKIMPELSIKAFTFSNSFYMSLKNTLSIANFFSKHKKIFNFTASYLNKGSYEIIQKDILKICDIYKESNKQKMEFVEIAEVNIEEWFLVSKGSVKGIISKNKEALSNIQWLEIWSNYIRIKNNLMENGLSEVIKLMENNVVSLKYLKPFSKAVIFNQLAKEIKNENLMKQFNGLEHNALVDEFKSVDNDLKKLQAEKIAYKVSRGKLETGNFYGKVGTFTEVSLIKREAGKAKKHIAIRSLLTRAKESIKVLKPCFMMSPMSVAQYLKSGEFNFDILVMDEASQIKPEDAVGSIIRADTIVIVGDPKQLSPSSFFDTQNSNEDEEDQNTLQVSESILNAVSPILINRKLSWHYRSKHESLIQFSNKNFYNSELVLFPSSVNKSDDMGIKFDYVHDGRFESRRNVKESKKVIEVVKKCLKKNVELSIGVVAMNATQQDEIDKEFQQALRSDGELNTLFEKNKKIDSLFIKNLENVQGDERDIIIISMTYGPETVGGRVAQRFGPINSQDGWRRLNVLFTRAKRCMHVISTMKFSDILVNNTSSEGVKALRSFLKYAESGTSLNEVYTGKEPDSDFEISVTKKLKDNGYDSVPQLGVSGYFLDIAVRDPGNPSKFLMAIECDGATYHSAKSRRDADRLRQEILESQGWEVKRIWSTDWFQNSEVAIATILQRLEKLKTTSPVSIETPTITEYKEDDFERGKDKNIDNTQESFALEDKLKKLRDRISEECPETVEDQRLLRPEMLEAFLTHQPCSRSEFLESVPYFLRSSISEHEARYLEEIFELIAKYKK